MLPSPVRRLKATWGAMSRAQRFAAAGVALAVLAGVAAGAYAIFKRPADISNPDVTFELPEKKEKPKKPKPRQTVNWPRFGYDVGRSKFLDAQSVKPPYRKLWTFEGNELIEFPPIVVGKRLYFIDNDGRYTALDAKTGKVVWRKRLAKLNASSPAYWRGVLYSVSLVPGQALAVRARDGKVLWRQSLGSRAESSPLVVRGRVYFGDEGGTFHALRAKDGATIWETSLTGSIKAAPALADGTLYVGDYGGHMSALRASDGKLRWQTSDLGTGFSSGRFYSTPAVAFGRVYAGNVDNRVYSFDAEDGRIAWTFSAGDYVYSGIAAANTKGTKPTVYFGSHDRNAYAVNARTGKLLWKSAVGGQVSGPATVVGDIMYVSTFSGRSTKGFDLGTGRRVFAYTDGAYGPVVSDGQTLYLTGGDSVIAMRRVDPGRLRYKSKPGQKGVIPPAEWRRLEKRLERMAGKRDRSRADRGRERDGSGSRQRRARP